MIGRTTHIEHSVVRVNWFQMNLHPREPNDGDSRAPKDCERGRRTAATEVSGMFSRFGGKGQIHLSRSLCHEGAPYGFFSIESDDEP